MAQNITSVTEALTYFGLSEFNTTTEIRQMYTKQKVSIEREIENGKFERITKAYKEELEKLKNAWVIVLPWLLLKENNADSKIDLPEIGTKIERPVFVWLKPYLSMLLLVGILQLGSRLFLKDIIKLRGISSLVMTCLLIFLILITYLFSSKNNRNLPYLFNRPILKNIIYTFIFLSCFANIKSLIQPVLLLIRLNIR